MLLWSKRVSVRCPCSVLVTNWQEQIQCWYNGVTESLQRNIGIWGKSGNQSGHRGRKNWRHTIPVFDQLPLVLGQLMENWKNGFSCPNKNNSKTLKPYVAFLRLEKYDWRYLSEEKRDDTRAQIKWSRNALFRDIINQKIGSFWVHSIAINYHTLECVCYISLL